MVEGRRRAVKGPRGDKGDGAVGGQQRGWEAV